MRIVIGRLEPARVCPNRQLMHLGWLQIRRYDALRTSRALGLLVGSPARDSPSSSATCAFSSIGRDCDSSRYQACRAAFAIALLEAIGLGQARSCPVIRRIASASGT